MIFFPHCSLGPQTANMNVIIPNIDEDIPLPASALDAMPELSPQEELAMRARTIKLIADLNGAALEPTEENIATAQELAKQMMHPLRLSL